MPCPVAHRTVDATRLFIAVPYPYDRRLLMGKCNKWMHGMEAIGGYHRSTLKLSFTMRSEIFTSCKLKTIEIWIAVWASFSFEGHKIEYRMCVNHGPWLWWFKFTSTLYVVAAIIEICREKGLIPLWDGYISFVNLINFVWLGSWSPYHTIENWLFTKPTKQDHKDCENSSFSPNNRNTQSVHDIGYMCANLYWNVNRVWFM